MQNNNLTDDSSDSENSDSDDDEGKKATEVFQEMFTKTIYFRSKWNLQECQSTRVGQHNNVNF